MGKEMRRMARVLLSGVRTFAAPPVPAPPPRSPRTAGRGVDRYFSAVGQRMVRAAAKLEAERAADG